MLTTEWGAGSSELISHQHTNPHWVFLPRCSGWDCNCCQILVSFWIFLWTKKPYQNPIVFSNFSIYHPQRTAEEKGLGGVGVGNSDSAAVLRSYEQKSLLEACKVRVRFLMKMCLTWPPPLVQASYMGKFGFKFCILLFLHFWKMNQKLFKKC